MSPHRSTLSSFVRREQESYMAEIDKRWKFAFFDTAASDMRMMCNHVTAVYCVALAMSCCRRQM